MSKRNYISPRSVAEVANVQHALCASGSTQSSGVSNVTENAIWGNSPVRRSIVH